MKGSIKKAWLLIDTRIWLFLVGLILFSVAACFKYALSGDERGYLADGIFWLTHGTWPDAKSIPLYGILLSTSTTVLKNSILAAQLIYTVFGSLLIFPIYYLSRVFFNQSIGSFAVLCTIAMPGLLVLPLYSGTHMPFIFLAYSSLAVLHYSIAQKKPLFSLLAGFLIGLSCLARMDGLIYMALLLIGLFIQSIYQYKTPFYLIAFGFLIGTLPPLVPWQLWLLHAGNHLVATAIWSHGHPTAWLTLADLLKHPATINFYALSNVLLKIVLMTRLYSEILASFRFIPIYIWIFVALGIIHMRKQKISWILWIPIVSTFSYLVFHVLARYLTPMIPVITLFSAAGIIYFVKTLNSVFKAKIILTLVILSLMLCDAFYLYYGHPTYSKTQDTNKLYYDIMKPSQKLLSGKT